MTRDGRKRSRKRRPRQAAKRPDRRPLLPKTLKQSIARLPTIGEWWKLADIAASIHVHPKTLRRWIDREPFFKKVKGTFFVELGGFKAWWAQQGFAAAAGQLP